MWEVEYTDEFKEWWDTLVEAAQDSISTIVTLLEETGKDHFYEEYIPIADRLYDAYLEDLKKEGLT